MIKDYLMENWKPELIRAYLQQMISKNLRVNVMSPTFKGSTNQV